MLSLVDSAYLITIGTSWWVTVILVGWMALMARESYERGVFTRGVAFVIFLALIPVVVVFNHGDRIQFRADGVRQIRLFREVDFVDWRHVESAETVIRPYWNGKRTRNEIYLVLHLKTGDTWETHISDLNPGEMARVLAFCLERAGLR